MPRIKKEIKELLCSANEDDIRLGFIMAKKLGYSVKQVDCYIQWAFNQGTKIEEIVLGSPDQIAKEFIEFKDTYSKLGYKCWKDDNDDTK